MTRRPDPAPATPGRDGETVLEAIRSAERAAARAVDAAHRDADERVRAAEVEAARLVRGARERGRRAGAREADVACAEAHRRADGERTRGVAAVEAFRTRVAARREAIVAAMLDVVVPPDPGDGGAPAVAARGEG